jgi:site-specific DNA-adenine methylase
LRYGLPYQGSKNSIAKWLISNLPSADTFVDLFCGGGAVTHCAMLSGKWNNFIMNDIDARLPILFKDCVYGKYTVENRREWVDRETFNRMKDKDAYIALVWSFGNNGKTYIYGSDIEKFKKDYHRAVYSNDTSILEKYGYKINPSKLNDVYGRYLEFNRQIKKFARNDLGILSRQIEIERLQSLQSLQSLGVDYRSVKIPNDAVIYCDIPYAGTNCGKYQGFNHGEFCEWAEWQDNIFISEYQMPEAFIPIAKTTKRVLSAANGNSKVATEYLFTNRKTYNRFSKERKEKIGLEMASQLSLCNL